MEFIKHAKPVWIPLVVVTLLSWGLLLAGQEDAGVFVSVLGTPLTIIGILVYIVAFDSRKRWPDLRWHDRLANVITFSRD